MSHNLLSFFVCVFKSLSTSFPLVLCPRNMTLSLSNPLASDWFQPNGGMGKSYEVGKRQRWAWLDPSEGPSHAASFSEFPALFLLHQA